MFMRTVAFFLALLFVMPLAQAVEPDEVLDDPQLEQRARDISKGLRCVVCQNESIDESNADLAKDLRILVRDRLQAGDTNDEVVEYVVARYGEFVLLAPRFGLHTLLLWITPVLLLLFGLMLAYKVFRGRHAQLEPGTPQPLSDVERDHLRRLLQDGADDSPGAR
jgi:cytochrome c-type biogenesis protein CcmH